MHFCNNDDSKDQKQKVYNIRRCFKTKKDIKTKTKKYANLQGQFTYLNSINNNNILK